MWVVADRVLETSTTTGTGNITLAGAVSGFQTFAAECSVGDTFPYYIEAVDGSGNPTGEYECGVGTLLTSSTFARSTVDTSSNSDALVSLSSGTKYVGIGITRRAHMNHGQAVAIVTGLSAILI